MYFDGWRASFVDGAGGKSVLPNMWPLLSRLAGSIVVSLDEVASAMKLAAERTHIIAEGAAGCAIAAVFRPGTTVDSGDCDHGMPREDQLEELHLHLFGMRTSRDLL